MSSLHTPKPAPEKPAADIGDAITYTKENAGVLPVLFQFVIGFLINLFKPSKPKA